MTTSFVSNSPSPIFAPAAHAAGDFFTTAAIAAVVKKMRIYNMSACRKITLLTLSRRLRRERVKRSTVPPQAAGREYHSSFLAAQ